MPPRPSDRALRRLVADLADRPKSDVKAVLADLGPDERARIERLMAEFKGLIATADTAVETSADVDVEGLSPWLTARLRNAAAGAPPADFAMTNRALQALRTAAASVTTDRRPAPKGRGGLGVNLYDLLTRWLGRPVR